MLGFSISPLDVGRGVMQVTFALDAEEAAAHYAENQPSALQVSTGWSLACLAISLLPVSFLLGYFGEWGIVGIGWLLAFLGLAALFVYAWLNLPAADPTPPFECTFRFSPECIQETGKDYLIRLSWHVIEGVRLGEKHLMIDFKSTEWVAPRRFTVFIPRRAFESDGAAEECAAFCAEQIAAVQAGSITPLETHPDAWPEIFRSTWQGDCFELRYRHADDDRGRLDPDGQESQRGVMRILSLYPLVLMVVFGMLLTGCLFEAMDSSERIALGLAAFMILPWFVLGILQGIARASCPTEPPALLNPQVSLTVHPQGMYFRTEVSEGFVPGPFLPPVEEHEEFLFFRGHDGTLSRVVPRTAFHDEDQMRHFVSAIDAARDGIVLAEGVNRVPPSDNPYRPPESA